MSRNTNDQHLRSRASKVIPGGMWGHMNAARMPEAFPQFFMHGKGSRLWDADGNEYLDFMCAYGPVILGYDDPDVEVAAASAGGGGAILNGPTDAAVELAELLVETIPHADWAMFQKNGTDATTTCVTLARAGTGRRKILVAEGAYHGAVPWCSPSVSGVTVEDRAHLIHYTYNDLDSLDRAVAQAGDDMAGIVVSAFRHDARKDQEMPSQAFANAVRAACDTADAALILDDVRAGFRLHLGGSWEPLGVHPDLSAWSKGIANGHPLGAVTGNDRFREAATDIFVTGSFWCAPGPMAAALATLKKLHSFDFIGGLEALGNRFRNGLSEQATRHGLGIRQTGPVQMPMVLFEDDDDLKKGYLFTSEALSNGIYLHPWHNMFLSAAHTSDDIDQALAATNLAMKSVADHAFREGRSADQAESDG